MKCITLILCLSWALAARSQVLLSSAAIHQGGDCTDNVGFGVGLVQNYSTGDWIGSWSWDFDIDDVCDSPPEDMRLYWDAGRGCFALEGRVNGIDYNGYLAQLASGSNYFWIKNTYFAALGPHLGSGFAGTLDPAEMAALVVRDVYVDNGYSPNYTQINSQFIYLPPWLTVAYIIPGGGSSGGSGVDADDWDYWFDLENGKFEDIYESIEYWMGGADDQPGGFYGNFQIIHQNAFTMISRLTAIQQALTTGSAGEFSAQDFTAAFDPSSFQPAIDTEVNDAEWLVGSFDDLIPNGTDHTAHPDMTFNLPLDTWFGSTFPGVQDISVTIETAPFNAVRPMLHVFWFAGVSLWSVLAIFGETRRT